MAPPTARGREREPQRYWTLGVREQRPVAPTKTSPHAKQPIPLEIVPGTPVVDLQQEVVGRVVAVTPAFCVFEVEGALCVNPWRNVARTG